MLPAKVSVRAIAPPPVLVTLYLVVASFSAVVAPIPPTPLMFTHDAVTSAQPLTVPAAQILKVSPVADCAPLIETLPPQVVVNCSVLPAVFEVIALSASTPFTLLAV